MKYLILLIGLSCHSVPKSVPAERKEAMKTVQSAEVSPLSSSSRETTSEIRLNWPDRRPIGMVFLASYPGSYTLGNRNWIFDKPAGFKKGLLALADVCVKNLKAIDAQGVVIWDIEGQEYPHPLSYFGDPRQLAPEMDSVADEFFAKFTRAGLKVGVTLRPDEIIRKENVSAWWPFHYSVADHAKNLKLKIAYAKKRWGCTLYYVDSNIFNNNPVGSDITMGGGHALPQTVFKEVLQAYPDCLLIPEHENNDYYAYTAPYNQWNTHSPELNSVVKQKYPTGFQCMTIGDSDWSDAQVQRCVKDGNILMGRVWYQAPELEKIKRAQQQMGQKH